MSDGKREWIGIASIGVGIGVAGLFGGLAAASSEMGWAALPVWFMVTGMIAYVSRSPIAKAVAARIANHSDAVDGVPDEVYAELDELRIRINELEERQDFSERVLAKAGPEGATKE